MAEIWLLCEGKTDVAIVSAVFDKMSAGSIVKSVDGEKNLSSAALFAQNEQAGSVVAYVRDRDYRSSADAEDSFTDNKRGFIWRRHSIENYLLEPPVIVEAFERLRASMAQAPGGAPAWARALPSKEETIAEALRQCARKRAPQEAGKTAIERLWEDLSETAGRVQRRVPKLMSGKDNPDAASCRQALVDEARRLVDKAREAAAAEHLEPSSIEKRYDDILREFSDPTYVEQMRFLWDFEGRELLWELCGWLRDQHQARLNVGLLIKELFRALPDVYMSTPNLFGTDDFRDLANGVRAFAGLPKLA